MRVNYISRHLRAPRPAESRPAKLMVWLGPCKQNNGPCQKQRCGEVGSHREEDATELAREAKSCRIELKQRTWAKESSKTIYPTNVTGDTVVSTVARIWPTTMN